MRTRAPGLHRFLNRDDRPYPFLREVLGAALVIVVVLAALWGFTGQRFPSQAPIVVIESGSMMHCVRSGNDFCAPKVYGRVGTIDPGDLVFVKDVDDRDDVVTFAAGEEADGRERYGKYGDVIVYRKNGDTGQTPIIHRAMLWLEVHDDWTFSIPELGISHVSDLNDDRLTGFNSPYKMNRDYHLSLQREHERRVTAAGGAGADLKPSDHSGFITKGDNNGNADQPVISMLPVRPEWILGKARGEIPWMGLIKLKFSDLANQFGRGFATNNFGNAPSDLKVMLWVSLGVLIVGPFTLELVLKRRHARKMERLEADGQGEIGRADPPLGPSAIPEDPPSRPPPS